MRALVLVVRVQVGIRRRIRMQAVGRRTGSRMRVQIWRLLQGSLSVSLTLVLITVMIPSKSLRRMTARSSR